MTYSTQVPLTPELVSRAARHLSAALKQSDADAAALCTLDGQCAWASDATFERVAPMIARIGVASLRLWAKARTGKLSQIGLVAGEGVIDLIFIPPIASLLVVSGKAGRSGWPENEPDAVIEAIGL